MIAALGGTLGQVRSRPGDDPWEAALRRHLLLETGPRELLEAAEQGDPAGRVQRLAEARSVLGAFAERDGRLSEAREHYQACAALAPRSVFETAWARGRLKHMPAAPAKALKDTATRP